jgi:hypothetical protein
VQTADSKSSHAFCAGAGSARSRKSQLLGGFAQEADEKAAAQRNASLSDLQ